MAKFKNKYRIESNRMPGWDYSGDGKYFITLVTQNRECNLGKIENNEMLFSDYGKIVKTEWQKSFEIRNELFLDEFQIMPNHLHAIIILKKTQIEKNNGSVGSHGSHGSHVETHGRASQPAEFPNFKRKPKSISSFIGGYKSAINTKIDDYIDEHNLDIPKYNRNNHFFQPNYHDRVIRDENEYWQRKNYIKNNPKNWDNDTFNTEL